MQYRKRLTVRGIVQGVGFRPAIAKEAKKRGLSGTIANARDSVVIEIQGDESLVFDFIEDFYNIIPPNAFIYFLHSETIEPRWEESSFDIIESLDNGPTRFSVPPDIAMCDQCRAEFYDPENRRYAYPFITCGNCGPRYTYMKDMPYDREKTTMSDFPFCPQCHSEYNDPANRRYHIEGFSCPICGPIVSGLDQGVEYLKEGRIVAIKGLGGYHIACSAIDYNAVEILRKRKRRPAKPFAVMFASVDMARQYADITPEEEALLRSKVSPIVVVPLKKNSAIAQNVAPDNGYIGLMIAYTPLHQLVLDRVNIPLVMTSANVSGDPLIIDDNKALVELASIVDFFIVHNRKILRRADDSISWVYRGQEINIRMGRGKMPFPIILPEKSKFSILALGAELKSNISVVSEDNLVTSNHIGDLETPETYNHFCDTITEMSEFYNVTPEVVVADLHPDYESTKYAFEYCNKSGARMLQVQHHYAHFLSCYFENSLKEEAIGIILDGTGFGLDGTIWGGEILKGNLHSFSRMGHISLFPLPGGERAIREPWRILAGLLPQEAFFMTCKGIEPFALSNIIAIKDNRQFSPLCSSAGRLFDAIAVILGFSRNVSYEAEAAIYLENLALGCDSEDVILLPERIIDGRSIIDAGFIATEIYNMNSKYRDLSYIAKVFHNTLAESFSAIAKKISTESGIDSVLLSGGVFQNRIMLEQCEKRLASKGVKVFYNKKIPTNDAGISVGQAIFGVYNA